MEIDRLRLPMRAFVFGLGCICLAWSGMSLPGAWYQAGTLRIAAKIIGGESFKADLIESNVADTTLVEPLGLCRPSVRRAAAILRLYLYEDAFASGRSELIDGDLASLRASLRRALSCLPTDAYLWLVLFSAENAAEGFKADNLEYLRRSYRFGPHEGWIALKRCPVVLAMLPTLDAGLRAQVLDEFASLIDNDLVDEAVAIFASVNLSVRQPLLDRIATLSVDRRERFADALGQILPSVSVPGITRHKNEPWSNK